jgi:ABC-2 type transport system ATP-binding protein
LTRRFGGRRGVEQVGFEIESGQVYGFLGPNGAGKSTTIRLLLGLYRPDAGTIRVLGLDPSRDARRINAQVGYLPGDLALHASLTGRQHLQRFAHARRLTDLAYQRHLVERFGAELDRPVRALSKGNRQKIGLVLAFMHRPDLLVLDEPSSGLDPLMQAEFAALIRETAAEGRTVFLSSHELDEVQRLVDQVAIIRDGRIVVSDSVAGLRAAAPRTITFRFPNNVLSGGDARETLISRFTGLPGLTVLRTDSTSVALSVSGPVTAALRTAAELGAVDVEARAADLEDLFLGYYRGDGDDRANLDADHAG